MNFEELEELIRRYLSAGIAAVVVIVAPGTGTAPDGTAADPEIRIIEPESGVPRGTGDPEPEADPPAEEDGSAPGNGRTPSSADPGSGSGSGDTSTNRDNTPETSSEDGTGGSSGSGTGSRTGNRGTDPDSDPETGSPSGSGSGSGSGTGSNEPNTPPSNDEPESDRPGSVSGDSGSGDRADEEAGGSERPSGTARDSGPAATSSEGTNTEGTTAAEVHGWGAPNREDDFSGGTEQWSVYDGPGHSGEGIRSPSAVSIENGILTITGDSAGTTAGMAWNPGQRYGRWEGRVRAPASDPSYNALLLLWPDAENFPVGGEIDFMEMLDHTRRTTDIFIHYGADNSQVNGQVEIDGTEWHNWAVEWTPEAITAYVDGEEWYRNTDTSIFPPGPMHLCVQLDWFPEGDTPQESYMYVDWVRHYSLDETTEQTTEDSSADTGGDPGDGQEDPMTRIREAFRRLFYGR